MWVLRKGRTGNSRGALLRFCGAWLADCTEAVFANSACFSRRLLDKLTAAYAAAARFDRAISTAREARRLDTAAQDAKLEARIRRRVEFYCANEPFFDARP
jgi:hypothetical protein